MLKIDQNPLKNEFLATTFEEMLKRGILFLENLSKRRFLNGRAGR